MVAFIQTPSFLAYQPLIIRHVLQDTQQSTFDDISLAFNNDNKLGHPAVQISAITTSQHQLRITKEKLAQRWGIGEVSAGKTFKVTTQKGIRNTLYPIERRFRTKQTQLRYPQLSGRHGRFYTDTFFSSIPAIDNSTCAQIFTNDIGFKKIYSMHAKGNALQALSSFIHEVGIPNVLHSDYAKELMQGQWRKLCQDFSINTTFTEPNSPHQNRAEGAIREAKRHIHRKMRARNVPKRLWNFCVKWTCDVRNCTARNSFDLDGRTPYEMVYGNTPDISSLCEFDFYEPVWYYDNALFPEDKRLMVDGLAMPTTLGRQCVIGLFQKVAYLLQAAQCNQ